MIPPRNFFPFFTLVVLVVAIFSPTVNAQPAGSFVLECTFRGGEGIVAPQQSLILDVILRPASPSVTVSASLTLVAHLTHLSLPEPRILAGFTTQITPNVPLPMSFVTPDNDGLYEIVLTVIHEQQTRTLLPITIANPYTRVQHQFVVLGSPVSPRPTGDWTLTNRRNLSFTDESSADSPSRRLLSHLPQLPHFPKVAELSKITDLSRPAELLRLPRPFHRQNSPSLPITDNRRMHHPGILLLPDSQGYASAQSERNPGFYALSPAGTDGFTWYSLPMDTEIGKPYLVEIDYPVNVAQTVGISVVEGFSPSEPTGGWSGMINVAADIHIAEEIVQDTPTESAATHRLLFWATTEHHDLILINRQPHQEALFRNIRISQVVTPGQQDSRLPKLFEGQAQRKKIGQILGNDIFPLPNSEARDPLYAVTIDRQKIYEKCSRLLDTLHRGGYDGVTLTVLSKGLVRYPNEMHNCLELMFRRFNSEGLTLIPAIEFDMPLPSLEQLLQQHPGITEEILVGNPEYRKYNLLHPAVQQAMQETVLALVDRFGHHPSFGGIAIVLSPETYAQLPFMPYPPDDYTFMQFRQATETELGIPFPDEQHFQQTLPIQQFLTQKKAIRLQFLRDKSKPKVWETWVRWRAATISGFYAGLAKQIAARQMSVQGSDAPLYLLGGTMFDQPEIRQFCVPTLPRTPAPLQAIQLLGFDLPLLLQTEALRFLKPVIVSEDGNHSYSYDGLNSSADTVPLFSKSGMLSGVQFVHTSGDTIVGSRTGSFVTTPAHIQSRKRFVRQLAQADVLMFMDAGVTLPFGQETAQFDLLDTYRRLPPVPFQTFQPPIDTSPSLQPLTVRYHNLPDGMIVYIVNDAPFAVEADFFFTADSRSTLTELTEHRMIRSLAVVRPNSGNVPRVGTHTWRASLLPYDLLAIRMSDANAKIESVTVYRPSAIEESLRRKVEELGQRVHAARGGVPLETLVNADFDIPPNTIDISGSIPGWQSFGNSLSVQQEHSTVGKGLYNVRLTNGSAEPGTFASQPFDMPATGRLDVSMFVGVPVDKQSLPMSVVLSAKHQERPLYWSAPIEKTLMPLLENVESRNGVRWHRVNVPFRLPLESLEEVRVGVQYSGIGTVWIDDVGLSLLSPNEIVELQKQLAVAGQWSSSGRVSGVISLLEGHWAQFLFKHIPEPIPQPMAAMASRPVAMEVPAPPQSPTWYQRVKGWIGMK